MAIGTGTAIALGLGAALGGAKGIANKKAGNRDRKIRAATIENSPWTKMGDPGERERPGMLDSVLQGTLSGAMMGQGVQGLMTPAAATLPGSEQGMTSLMSGSAPALSTSSLDSGLLQQQALQNPYMQQSTWGGLMPGRVA